MIYYVDIDGTIANTPGCEYEKAEPIPSAIEQVNRLYKAGNTIVYWTARGQWKSRSPIWKKACREMTRKQLKLWGCLYHRLSFDKPLFDKLYDDRAETRIPHGN